MWPVTYQDVPCSLWVKSAFRDVPDVQFGLAGYPAVFTIRFRFGIQPKCRTAPDIATGYFTVSITALEHECHKIWLALTDV